MPLANWLYVSSNCLSTAEADKEIGFIVAASRARNYDLDVTGALLFTGTRFVQFLEGPDAGIEALRNDIAGDTRHADLVTVATEAGEARRFDGWSLAYAGASHLVGRIVEQAVRDAKVQPAQAAGNLIALLANFSPLS